MSTWKTPLGVTVGLGLAIFASFGGCNLVPPTPETVPTVAGFVVATATDTPVLQALATGKTTTDASVLGGVSDKTMTTAMASATGVLVDAALVTDIAKTRSLIDAALSAGKPVVVDNVTDEALLAQLIGMGFAPAGEDKAAQQATSEDFTVLVEPADGGRDLLVTVMGASGAREIATSPAHEAETEEDRDPNDPDDQGADPNAADYDADPPAAPTSEVMSTDDLTDEERVTLIETHLANPTLAAKALANAQDSSDPSVPAGVSYRAWLVDFANEFWAPDPNQTDAFIVVDFKLELFGSSQPKTKYLRVSTFGPGAGPGTLAYPITGRQEGYFQDRVQIQIDPTENIDGLKIAQHSPANENNVTSVTSETGFDVGFSADSGGTVGLNGSYHASRSITTNLADFRVVNLTNPFRGLWSYELANVGGHGYDPNNPGVFFYRHKCHLDGRGAPTLATNVLQPNVQMVFTLPATYDGQAPFTFTERQRLMYVQVYSEHCKFIDTLSWKYRWYWHEHTRTRNFAVDFSTVTTD